MRRKIELPRGVSQEAPDFVLITTANPFKRSIGETRLTSAILVNRAGCCSNRCARKEVTTAAALCKASIAAFYSDTPDGTFSSPDFARFLLTES